MAGHDAASKHLVCIAGNFYGHYKSLVVALPALLESAPNLTATYVCHKSTLQRVEDWISACEPTEEVRARFKVIAIGGDLPANPKDAMSCYNELVEVCTGDRYNELFGGRPEPNAVITDYFLWQIAEHLKTVGNRATRFIHQPNLPSSLWQLHIFRAGETDICKAAGTPDLFAHELVPCSLPWPNGPDDRPARLVRDAHGPLLSGSHHMLATFSRDLVAGQLDAYQQALVKGGKRALDIGAQISPSFWQPYTASEGDDEVTSFLDAKLKSHGEQSVLWISFGSVFWPATRPGLLDAVIDTLIKADKPFILLMTSFGVNFLPDKGAALKERINTSGVGLATGWCNQQVLIKHPATGCFLTHGGTNTVIECLAAGIPMICWPMGAEQPATAALLTIKLAVSWELHQVKDLLVGKKLLNDPDIVIHSSPEAVRKEFEQVLKELDGPIGARKRANAEKAAQVLRREHQKQSTCYAELIAMFA